MNPLVVKGGIWCVHQVKQPDGSYKPCTNPADRAQMNGWLCLEHDALVFGRKRKKTVASGTEQPF